MTREHVIAKQFYSKPIKKAITVLSCSECNQGFQKDEEFLRLCLTAWAADYSVNARKLFFSKVKRSIQRCPAIGRMELEKMDLVNLYTPGGIYLGPKTRMKVTPDDWRRIYRVLDKIIRGLIFHELGGILPSEYLIKHCILLDEVASLTFKEKLESSGCVLKWNRDNEETCFFGYDCIPNSYTSIWALVFYRNIVFKSLVGTEKNFAGPKESVD